MGSDGMTLPLKVVCKVPNCDLEEFVAQIKRLAVVGTTCNTGFNIHNHNQTFDVLCTQKKTAMMLKLRWGGNV